MIQRISASPIVFDGNGDGVHSEDATRASDCAVLFSPASMTADDVIEQLVGGPWDRPIRSWWRPGIGTSGPPSRHSAPRRVSPENFRAWVDRCGLRQSGRVRRGKGNKPFGNAIPL